MSDVKKPNKMKITHTKSKDYRILYADSALVGQAAAKAITLDFYVGNVSPRNEIYPMDENGQITGKFIYEEGDVRAYERTLQVQIVMTAENAQLLINGITERLKTIKAVEV